MESPMSAKRRKIVIIGAGIAGLCTAVYASKSGYDVELLEKHDKAGGLATSWRRGDYTFETCLHWLLGSAPGGMLHAHWQEVFDIEKLTFVEPAEYARIENARGQGLSIYTDIKRLTEELLWQAPRDSEEIHHLAAAVRRLAKVEIPDPSDHGLHAWLTLLRALPELPLLHEWSGLSLKDYGGRFKHPLLRAFFADGGTSDLSALAFVFSLAWMGSGNAGYPIGGSQAVIKAIADNLTRLGGRIRYGVDVQEIIEEKGVAIGVRLASGEIVRGDWIVSAADGNATIHKLLGGRHRSKEIDEPYATLKTFPSYLQVSLGVAMDLSRLPAFLVRVLDTPFVVDPATQLSQISFRFFHFDPTFAPRGKTAVTCFLPTRNYDYWAKLAEDEPSRYSAEKERIAQSVSAILEDRVGGIQKAIEVVDVATPATVMRYTGNWQGSMEGWLLLPGADYKPLHSTLPGLEHFRMVGQWVMPGGGLPSGLMTARAAIYDICREDHAHFSPERLAS
jgi:phytoene dehydrogenase-like protein